MSTFTDTTKIKRMLGISNGLCTGTTQYDDVIEDLRLAVDQIVLDELNLTTAAVTTYSERIDINFVGQNEIALNHRPVGSIVALTIGGQLQTLSTTVDDGGTYVLNSDLGVVKLTPLYVSFPTGRSVINVTYTAGFSSVPADLLYAGNLIAVSLFNQQSHVGFRSEKVGSYSYQMDSGIGSTIPQIAQRILNKHRRLFARGAIYV